MESQSLAERLRLLLLFLHCPLYKHFLHSRPSDDDEPPLISSGDLFVERIIVLTSKSFSGRQTTVNWFGEHNRAGARTYIIFSDS